MIRRSKAQTICVLVAAAVLLAACASGTNFRAGGYGGGRSGGAAGVGIPF